MKRQDKKEQDTSLDSECTASQPIAFDENVEELLNHLGDLIGEILISEIINPNIEKNMETIK